MKGKVLILLPVHNRKEITRNFMSSLLQQDYPHYHLVLIDDGSTDGTAEMVTSLLPAATIITGNGNWWWGGSLQQGYQWVMKNSAHPDDVVLILNDDVEFGTDYLRKGVEFVMQYPDTLLVSQAWSKQTGVLLDAGVHINWKKMSFTNVTGKEDINCLSTRGLFMKAPAFKSAGGFRPHLLPHYLSDYEFTIRAGRKGFTLLTDPGIRLVMNEATTGIHTLKKLSVSKFIKHLFSLRSSGNPWYFSIFLIMVCPPLWLPLNLARIWGGSLKKLLTRNR
ncbi:glycosyltransferase family 2 protein [Chitinophaga solisilvae]|uniref:Glycosyltransferase family 2 protein n=1 Tax=Chitinophaga solisilvae TaxID=1233460 RepID=A0A3S1AZS3_9BACT|nr:glycosyltransferase [Chitinophaga solisilvae]NSL90796.1 glycosyltransferase family 2 protein [Chitinophaga solisilvae]